MQSSTTPDPGYQWESDKLIVDTTNESQEVSTFPAGDLSKIALILYFVHCRRLCTVIKFLRLFSQVAVFYTCIICGYAFGLALVWRFFIYLSGKVFTMKTKMMPFVLMCCILLLIHDNTGTKIHGVNEIIRKLWKEHRKCCVKIICHPPDICVRRKGKKKNCACFEETLH